MRLMGTYARCAPYVTGAPYTPYECYEHYEP